MKNLRYFIIVLSISSLILIQSGCDEEDSGAVLPNISLKTGGAYISTNTATTYGDSLLFGINANSNGTDNLVKFQILFNGQIVIDSTFNATLFTGDYFICKSLNDKDSVRFEVTDIAGNINNILIIITGEFGALNAFNNIILGAQNNASVESFLSFSNNNVTKYFQADAFNNQADIDMFCFYEDTVEHQNFMTLAAPGSFITGIFIGATSPENYTVVNTTWFVKTSLSVADYDAVQNDAMVLASFDDQSKLQKADTLTAGDVYAFLIESGKYGLFKVVNVTGVEDGTLEIAVKMQP